MTDPIDLDRPTPVDYRLELYLHLIEKDRPAGCSERLLADEIHRLRALAVAQGEEIARLRTIPDADLVDVLNPARPWPSIVALLRFGQRWADSPAARTGAPDELLSARPARVMLLDADLETDGVAVRAVRVDGGIVLELLEEPRP